MRVLACEFVTGGGCAGGPLRASLVPKGDLMLRALVDDLTAVPGVRAVATRDARLPADLPAEIVTVPEDADAWEAWEVAIACVDAVWPVAPETGGLLARLTDLVLSSGRTLLGSRPEAIRTASSKAATARVLAAAGLAVTATVPLLRALADGPPPSETGWVVKPDDGAGAERTAVVRDAARLAEIEDGDGLVVQPFVVGEAASISLLCKDGQAMILACNAQHVEEDADRLRYRGGVVGGREERRTAYAPVAGGVAAAMPGLFGIVGVDLVDGPDGPVAIEVNPRPCVPYAGLRRAIGMNPAELLLALLERDLDDLPRPTAIRPVRLSL